MKKVVSLMLALLMCLSLCACGSKGITLTLDNYDDYISVAKYFHSPTDGENTLFVGDQIFTDVMGGNLAGIRTILVKPIHPKEEIQIVLKRIPEKLILFFYKITRKVFGEKYESSAKS